MRPTSSWPLSSHKNDLLILKRKAGRTLVTILGEEAGYVAIHKHQNIWCNRKLQDPLILSEPSRILSRAGNTDVIGRQDLIITVRKRTRKPPNKLVTGTTAS